MNDTCHLLKISSTLLQYIAVDSDITPSAHTCGVIYMTKALKLWMQTLNWGCKTI